MFDSALPETNSETINGANLGDLMLVPYCLVIRGVELQPTVAAELLEAKVRPSMTRLCVTEDYDLQTTEGERESGLTTE